MDVGFLKPLYERPGPYASVYIDTERDQTSAEHTIRLRWRGLRRELEAEGADAATLDAIDGVIGTDRGLPEPRGQAVFAAGGEVLLREELRAPNVPELAQYAALPDLLPMLAQRPDVPAHVLVLVDRSGADVEVHTPLGVSVRADARGRSYPLTKVGAGDWNQSRYQRRAENAWEANAREAAALIERIAEAHRAAVIAVAGDVRARSLLLDHLGPRWRVHAVDLHDGARGDTADADRARVAAAVAAARFEADVRADMEQRFARGLAEGGAVQGVARTVEALRRGEVDTLLLRFGAPQLEAPVWWGPDPGQLALDPEEVAGMRAPQTRRDRAADVLVRAVVETRGQLLVTCDGEPGPAEGVGALLRGR